MANVTIVTPMRDSAAKMSAYIGRVNALEHDPAGLRVIVVEGDSVDDTWQRLQCWAANDSRVTVLKCDTMQPRFGSVVSPLRFWILATTFNAGLEAVDLDWSSHVLFIPDDIEYEPDMLARLLARDKSIVAPFVFLRQRQQFYDTWAFQQEGRQAFDAFQLADAPARFGDSLVRMDSVGGVMLSHAAVLRAGVRYGMETVDRGYCFAARARGFSVWADPTVTVWHPLPEHLR